MMNFGKSLSFRFVFIFKLGTRFTYSGMFSVFSPKTYYASDVQKATIVLFDAVSHPAGAEQYSILFFLE